MDKYKKIRKTAEEEVREDEIKVTARGRTGTYVTYAAKLLTEKELSTFSLKATGAAIATVVQVAEVVKRRFKGLHQITKLGSLEVVDEWEPLEEGLDKVVTKRMISFIEITLSKDALDTTDVGYQEPIDESLVVDYDPERPSVRSKKSKGKGKKGKGKKGKGKKGKDGKKGSKGSGKKGSKGKGKKGKGKKKDDDE